MMTTPSRPKVGVGMYIFNSEGKVLLGLRKGNHAPDTWCPPGGHLEFSEAPADAAAREAQEEAGVSVCDIEEVGFTNDVFKETGKHYITLHLRARLLSGEVKIMEPDKCSKWEWFEPDNLPEPLFLASENAVKKFGVISY